MDAEFTDAQKTYQKTVRKFVDQSIVPFAGDWDKDQAIPRTVFQELGSLGYLAPSIPEELGGRPVGAIEQGILSEELGRGSMSLVSDFIVHNMCVESLLLFGSDSLKHTFLPQMVSGETLGAFALSEPEIGSDAGHVKTTAEICEGGFKVNGVKKWISFAQMADLFLLITQTVDGPCAFLLRRDDPGVSVTPISDMLGYKAAMIGALQLEDVFIPEERQLGRIGGGFSQVAGSCLDLGRYIVATASVGLANACLEASLHYAQGREQFGKPLRDHQLIMEMLANMVTQTKAARALCMRAGTLRESRDPRSMIEISTAKYFASTMASKVANDTVQIHGAHGCGPEYPIERYFRDARIGEIIEGSNQMQQIMISKSAYIEHRRALKNLTQQSASSHPVLTEV